MSKNCIKGTLKYLKHTLCYTCIAFKRDLTKLHLSLVTENEKMMILWISSEFPNFKTVSSVHMTMKTLKFTMKQQQDNLDLIW